MSGDPKPQEPDPRIAARQDEVRKAFDLGWLVTPLAGKKPFRKNWQTEAAPDLDTALKWAETKNIGVRTGKASNLGIIDDDTLDGSGAAALDLPPTPTVLSGGGKKHYYFLFPAEGLGCSNKGLPPNIDIKGEGGAIVLPGSIHPETGRTYEWMPGLSPREVPFAEFPKNVLALLKNAKRAASASRAQRLSQPSDRLRLERYAMAALERCAGEIASASEGSRNDELNRQAFKIGRFVGAGILDRAVAIEQLTAAARDAGLEDGEIAATLASGLDKGGADGYDTNELLVKMDARKAQSLGGNDSSSSDTESPGSAGRPVILVEGGRLPVMVTEAEAALLKALLDQIYQRGGILVRLVRQASMSIKDGIEKRVGALSIVFLDAIYLGDRLTEVASFQKFDARSAEYKAVDCPERVANTLLARSGRWKAKVLIAIIEAPTIRPDGTVLEAAGYDEATRLFLDPGDCQFPPVPASPTLEDAKAALAKLKEPFSEFPWVEPCDKSVVLAAILTALVRPTLRAAPMFVFRAPKMGSGKSLLADCVSLLATGRDAPVMTQSQNDDEDRKRMLAVLLEGQPVVCIDNVERPLGGAAICSVLTQEVYRDRVLGVSKTANVPTSTTWLATGNNIVILGDLVSRVLPCDIDPKHERPETREFALELRPYLRDHRGELVVAALTILRAYHVAGCPPQGLPVFGRFEAWSKRVRSALVWAGEPDPCLGRERLQRVDPISEQIRGVLMNWEAVHDDRAVTVNKVIESAAKARKAPLFGALMVVADDSRGELDARRLGNWLAKHERRIEGGMYFERAGDSQGVTLWRVRRAAR